jgi:hypothetical protein
MTLQSAIEAELPFLRAEAEALMPDEFEFGDYGDGWHYDTESGEDVRDFDLLFTTRGKVMTSTAPGEVEVGGRTAVEISRVLHIPVGTPAVPQGTVARSGGREYRILAEVTHPQPKSRRFAVEEVLS